jgi:hypothetical protein
LRKVFNLNFSYLEMKKSIWFLGAGVVLFVISFILFISLKEIITIESGDCLNKVTCGPQSFLSYGDAFTPEFTCPMYCFTNASNQSFVVHNPLYVIFVWLGSLAIFIGLVLLVLRK